MNWKQASLIATLIIGVSPGVAQVEVSADDIDTPAIYAAILERLSPPADSPKINLILEHATVPSAQDTDRAVGIFDGYEFLGARQLHAEDGFGGREVNLIATDELKAMFEGGCEEGWNKFYQEYGVGFRGLMGLSDIAVDATGMKAAAYWEIRSGCLLGYGLAVYLTKEGGKWILDESSSKYLWGGY